MNDNLRVFKKEIGLDGDYWNKRSNLTPGRKTRNTWSSTQESKHSFGNELVSLQNKRPSHFLSNFTRDSKERFPEMASPEKKTIKQFLKTSETLKKLCLNQIDPGYSICDAIDSILCNGKSEDEVVTKNVVSKAIRGYERKLKREYDKEMKKKKLKKKIEMEKEEREDEMRRRNEMISVVIENENGDLEIRGGSSNVKKKNNEIVLKEDTAVKHKKKKRKLKKRKKKDNDKMEDENEVVEIQPLKNNNNIIDHIDLTKDEDKMLDEGEEK